MIRERMEKEIRQFSCRPRCCDWCEKRGLKIDPLVPTVVVQGYETLTTFRFWVHRECAEFLREQPDVRSAEFVELDA